MKKSEAIRGRKVVLQPGEGKSFWQPVPANGFAEPRLVPGETKFEGVSLGFQTIAPGSYVREHSHDNQIEMLVGFSGRGTVKVDGVPHPMVPGTTCFLGYDVKHQIINETDEDLVMVWAIAPAGLEEFFETIGRPREEGEPAPEPFARPVDTDAIDRRSGMDATAAEA